MKNKNGKLWRKIGYRNLSGRLYGAARQQVYISSPSPLILHLISGL